MKIHSLLLWIGLVLVAGCSGVPVSVDYQPGYDFSQINRYYWLSPKAELQSASIYNSELVGARVEQAVEHELLSLGILRTDAQADADVLVGYQIGIEKLVDIDTHLGLNGSFSRRSGVGLSLLGGHSREYDQSTLVIDLRDPGDNRLLWRGMAERRLSRFDTPQIHAAFIAATVAAVLVQYPPPQQ
ncbi:MAG: hypothetical protein ACI9W6_002288 [Motiliproteus sp.]|jgi:hypothetical protein